jgi:hypothetical protein
MSANRNISEFAQCAKALALLAAIPLDESPEKFSSAVSEAFKKIPQGKTKAFLVELFVTYLSEGPAPSGEYSTNFQRAIETACNPLLEAVRTYLRQAPNDSAATTVVAPQLQAYEQMLQEKERARLGSIHQKALMDRQCQLAAQAAQAAQAKAAQLAQRRLLSGSVALAALPLLIVGIKYFGVWWSQSNYAAMLFYMIFALVGLLLFFALVGPLLLREFFADDEYDGFGEQVMNLGGGLTFGLMLLLITLYWGSVANIVQVILLAGAVVLPFIRYARVALGSVAAGIILSFAARICSFVLTAFLGWVLPAEPAAEEKAAMRESQDSPYFSPSEPTKPAPQVGPAPRLQTTEEPAARDSAAAPAYIPDTATATPTVPDIDNSSNSVTEVTRKPETSEPEGQSVGLRIAELKGELASVDTKIQSERQRWQEGINVINRLTNFKRTPVREGSPQYHQCLAASRVIQEVEAGAPNLKAEKARLEAVIKSLEGQ